MFEITSLLNQPLSFSLPFQWIGWLGWFGLASSLIWLLLQQREPLGKILSRRWLLLAVLLLSVPVTTLLVGVSVQIGQPVAMPNLPGEAPAPIFVLLFAIPWVVAAGTLGVIPAVLMAIFGGIFLALWGTHQLFTPLEVGGLALFFSLAVRQNFRTRFFSALRHPLIAALVIGICAIPVFLISAFFAANGELAVRFDFALTQSWLNILVRIAEMLIGGMIAEIFYLSKAKFWYRPVVLEPSPTEVSLRKRFIFQTTPLLTLAVFALLIGDWVVAGNAARQMVRQQLSSTAEVAAESMPYFLETGQSLILMMADPAIMTLNGDEIDQTLATQLSSVPYFNQLFIFDTSGQLLSGKKDIVEKDLYLSQDEKLGISLALKGVLIQTYAVGPLPKNETTHISFIVSIQDTTGEVKGVLLGRTDMKANPFTQPAIEALLSIHEAGGEAMILDEHARILYYTLENTTSLMTTYPGILPESAEFYEDFSAKGTRQWSYFQPIPGRGWSVILQLPASQSQATSLQIAFPLMVILLFFTAGTLFAYGIGLRSVTYSLQNLSGQAELISHGQLEHTLQVEGVDEIGRLGRSFEKMRLSLKARLDELNRLLDVSQGVAANLDVQKAVQPVLDAALISQASSARIVLLPDVQMDLKGGKLVSFGTGKMAEQYAHLDGPLFELMRSQDVMPVGNFSRMRRLSTSVENKNPGAVLAASINHENAYFGVLWVAFDVPHSFSDEDIRFIHTLVGQAALAAANARHYAAAEIGRQRLAAVLDSTPEPVLVFDHKDTLLLVNPAAEETMGLIKSTETGKSIVDVVEPIELSALLQKPIEEKLLTGEITLANKRVYFASVAPVVVEKISMGKICILRDITHYKELDSLKSEFVATVSHDIRSPLTLIRGYTTMLPMVGEINEQQDGYVKKIISGVESMSRLVNNLLDLGRIESGIDLKPEIVSTEAILEQVIGQLQPQASQKSIQLSMEQTNDHIPMIEADPALVYQAVYNLVENAIKYTRLSGQVRITVQPQSDRVVIGVHDNGMGISPIDLDHVFEKFFRSGRRESYQQRGTGLGLAIVKSIAERHGGYARADSTLGKGSSFFVEFPVRLSPEKRMKKNGENDQSHGS